MNSTNNCHGESGGAVTTRPNIGVIVALALGLVLALPAGAQPPGPGGRGGGLLPARETPSISGGLTREEILRRFDLDANGTIDEGEAETARVRMRRERIETLRNSGVDPLTGRPRGDAAASGREPAATDDLILIPGNPAPASRPRAATEDSARPPASRPPAIVTPGRTPALTGGVRAGAPAVRPGYGAQGPKQDLNAGRPRDPQPQSQPRPTAARGRTGIPAAGRAPAQTGSPRTGLFPQGSTRPTAEDFGR